MSDDKLAEVALDLGKGALKLLLLIVPREKVIGVAQSLVKRFWERKLGARFSTRLFSGVSDKIEGQIEIAVAEDLNEFFDTL